MCKIVNKIIKIYVLIQKMYTNYTKYTNTKHTHMLIVQFTKLSILYYCIYFPFQSKFIQISLFCILIKYNLELNSGLICGNQLQRRCNNRNFNEADTLNINTNNKRLITNFMGGWVQYYIISNNKNSIQIYLI